MGNGQILRMLYRKNLHARVTAVIFSERDSQLSITTPRFLVLGDEVTVVSPSEMEKLEKGEVRAGMKISSVLPGLSFRWWLSIQLWMSVGQADIRVETCVSTVFSYTWMEVTHILCNCITNTVLKSTFVETCYNAFGWLDLCREKYTEILVVCEFQNAEKPRYPHAKCSKIGNCYRDKTVRSNGRAVFFTGTVFNMEVSISNMPQKSCCHSLSKYLWFVGYF